MFFDIASLPGGIDLNYCSENNIFAVLRLSIPGIEFPYEAGEIIADSVIKHMTSL